MMIYSFCRNYGHHNSIHADVILLLPLLGSSHKQSPMNLLHFHIFCRIGSWIWMPQNPIILQKTQVQKHRLIASFSVLIHCPPCTENLHHAACPAVAKFSLSLCSLQDLDDTLYPASLGMSAIIRQNIRGACSSALSRFADMISINVVFKTIKRWKAC